VEIQLLLFAQAHNSKINIKIENKGFRGFLSRPFIFAEFQKFARRLHSACGVQEIKNTLTFSKN
jgi:hypothetical protein